MRTKVVKPRFTFLENLMEGCWLSLLQRLRLAKRRILVAGLALMGRRCGSIQGQVFWSGPSIGLHEEATTELELKETYFDLREGPMQKG